MSLLLESLEDCVIMDRRTAPDGYGGYTITWVDGAPFKAATVLSNSIEARIAEQAGFTALYTVTTRKNINLQYHDIFRRIRDGKIFRVKSDGDDNKTPASANLDMRQVTAEEYKLPA